MYFKQIFKQILNESKHKSFFINNLKDVKNFNKFIDTLINKYKNTKDNFISLINIKIPIIELYGTDHTDWQKKYTNNFNLYFYKEENNWKWAITPKGFTAKNKEEFNNFKPHELKFTQKENSKNIESSISNLQKYVFERTDTAGLHRGRPLVSIK